MTLTLEKISPQVYFDLEKESEIRHEYADGILIPMSGESRLNNRVVLNCYSAFRPQLRGTGCEIYTHDVRLVVQENRVYRYPDLILTCATETDSHAVTQPCLIIEVLSATTESTDRNQKLREYTSIPSLDYYLLVSTDEVLVECYSREPDGGWRYHFYAGLAEEVKLEKVKGILLKLADVYLDVEAGKDQKQG